jgi:ElaB/YqjD/DUF883 family membrane-anchored ribosome-binding protein
MAAAERSLDKEFDALRADMEALRKDLAALLGAVGDAASDELKSRGGRARAAATRARAALGEAAEEAERRGTESLASLEQRIEERPLASVLIAFGVGLLVGKLLER